MTATLPPITEQPTEQPAAKKYEWQVVPPLGCSDEEAKTFMDYVFKESRLRRWHMLRMARNLWFHKDRHWFSIPRELVTGSSGGYKFVDVRPRGSSNTEPPQDNRIALGVDNEVARLVARELEPAITAERPQPDLEAAADLAKAILLHDIEQAHYPDLRRGAAFDLVIGGTATGRAYWDETATDLTAIAAPSASICPGCEQKFASTTIATEFMRSGIPQGDQFAPFLHAETVKPLPAYPGNRLAQMTHCPMCDTMTPLMPYSVTVEDATGGQDIFGQSLGMAVPKGNGLFELVSQFDVFPQDGGRVEPQNCKIMAQKSIRELEWIAPRIPEEFVEGLTRGDAKEMAKHDPTLGDPYFSGADPEVLFKHHNFLEEVYVQPMDMPGLDSGRRFWRVGDEIVQNDALMVDVNLPPNPRTREAKTKKVARCTYGTARFVGYRNEYWGRTPVDRCISPQRRLNKILYMMDELRNRGIPWVAVRRGTEIMEREETSGVLRYVEIESEDPQWSVKDNIVNADPITGNTYRAELADCIATIEAILGPKPVEAGINQPGVKSGDQAELLAEEARQKRMPQEQELLKMHERLFTAHMEQTWAFRKEETEYEVERAADQRERDSYRGEDLLGQVNAKVEATGKQERSLAQANKTIRAIQSGLVDIMTDDVAKQKALELLDLPPLNEEKSIQVKRAEQAWSEFTRDTRIPVVDTTVTDTWIWYMVLGKRWMGDEGLRLQRTNGWDEFVKAISGWEKELAQAETMDAQAQAIYGGHDPTTWGGIKSTGDALAQAAGMPPLPAFPPTGEFLPPSLYDRLILTWDLQAPQYAEGAVPMEIGPKKKGPAFQDLKKFYAVIQQCRLEAQRKKAAAEGGAPVLASPGGSRTVAGTEPVGGAPVIPTPGAQAAFGGAA